MNKTITAAALFAALSFSAPAFAQDDEANFSGPTITAIAGYDSVKFKAGGNSESKSGFAYGGAIGFDQRFNNFVLGAEAELADSTTKYDFGSGVRLETGRDIYVGARAGVIVSPNTLLYAKAGYTNAKLKGVIGNASDSDNLDGFRIGGGGEVAYGKAFGRLEYRYSDYGEYENSGLNISRHQVVAAIGYRF